MKNAVFEIMLHAYINFNLPSVTADYCYFICTVVKTFIVDRENSGILYYKSLRSELNDRFLLVAIYLFFSYSIKKNRYRSTSKTNSVVPQRKLPHLKEKCYENFF